jgi:UrcA family protein
MLKTIPALAALAVAAVLVTPTVTQAAEADSMRVPYADLNLAAAPGQRVLRGRILEAARTVCEFEDSRALVISTATNLCRSDAVQRAEPAYEAAVAAARHGTVTVLESAAIVVSGS